MSILSITKEELVNRLKSLAWRIGMMTLGVVITFLADNLGMFNFSPAVAGMIGLVLAEVTKQINKNLVTLKGLAGQNR